MKPATREWLELSEVDLRAAGTLCPDPLLTAAVAFHSQQAVEKAFKAIIAIRWRWVFCRQGGRLPPRRGRCTRSPSRCSRKWHRSWAGTDAGRACRTV